MQFASPTGVQGNVVSPAARAFAISQIAKSYRDGPQSDDARR
jgi:hypothetical protein